MKIGNRLRVTDRARWRAWLEENHSSETEVWVVFYKKHTGEPSIAYDEAVEEALCFGWIDGVIQRIDDDRYGRRFTPRRDGSSWSAINKRSEDDSRGQDDGGGSSEADLLGQRG